jgi:CRISPR-associated endonuclease Cas2
VLHIVVYDITSNKSRKKIADQLLNLGLIRAQYSVFIGDLAKNRVDEIALFAETLLAKTDRLYLIPVQRDAVAASRMVGQELNEALVANELLTMVL